MSESERVIQDLRSELESSRAALSASVHLGAEAVKRRLVAEELLRIARAALLLDDEQNAVEQDERAVRLIEAYFGFTQT